MVKIHHTAEVQTKNIGQGTVIWQYVIILSNAVIGKNCNINSHCFIENDVFIGDNVTIKCGVYLWDGTKIENDVFIGPNVTFVNDPYSRSKMHLKKYFAATIEQGASIGANATILSNIKIGRYAMIGAGSVVTKDIPPYNLWVGNPARQIGYITKDGVSLDLNMMDKKTGQYYFFDGENFRILK